MTNAQIIFNESQRLAAEGIIKYTGRVFKMQDMAGDEVIVKETEEIHTYNAWKDMGFQVQKGEKAVAQFVIWKYRGKVNEETNEEEGQMFMKRASFFTRQQVKAIA